MMSFAKNPRPEIWPVKEEHSFPEHQYRNNDYVNENHAAGSLKYHSDREYQKMIEHKSPGPAAYVIPQYDHNTFSQSQFKNMTS